MKGIWFIIVIMVLFIAYAYFDFGDSRLYYGKSRESNNATTTGQEASILLPQNTKNR